LIAVLSIGGLSLYMAMFEDKFIYFPDKELQQTPALVGLEFEGYQFKTSDGVILHGWYIPHPSAQFIVLHLHGNAGNISHRLSLYRHWHKLGLSIFAFDYRGYGQSKGEPTEEGLYKDARAAWSLLMNTFDIQAEYIIISGRSLGAAVATKLATEQHPAGLVLETPFSNIVDMAAYHYPWFPLRWLAHNKFDTEKMISDVDLPLLLISAKSDAIAPAFMADRIFAAASNPKRHITLDGGHNDFDMVSEQQYLESWQNWLDSLPREHASD